jgi:hypothetical protein
MQMASSLNYYDLPIQFETINFLVERQPRRQRPVRRQVDDAGKVSVVDHRSRLDSDSSEAGYVHAQLGDDDVDLLHQHAGSFGKVPGMLDILFLPTHYRSKFNFETNNLWRGNPFWGDEMPHFFYGS